jgi:hypothetical protein
VEGIEISMATTAIVAETLIIGLQTTLWLALLVMNSPGVLGQLARSLKGWEVLAGVYVFAVAYALGIIFDRLTAAVHHPFEKRAWEYLQQHHYRLLGVDHPVVLPHFDAMRMDLRVKNQDIADEVDDVRRPMRVVRATVFNLLVLIGVLVSSLTNVHSHIISQDVSRGIAVFSAVALIMAVVATIAIDLQFYRKLVRAYCRACPDLCPADLAQPGPLSQADSPERSYANGRGPSIHVLYRPRRAERRLRLARAQERRRTQGAADREGRTDVSDSTE